MMRKFLLLLIVAIIPALGCDCLTESIRRADVWAQQKFFTPRQPAIAAPMDAVCGPAQPAEPACGPGVAESDCGPSATEPATTGYIPDSVTSSTTGTTEEVIPGPALPEVSDSVLKQP